MKYCFLIAGLGSGGAERVVSSLANYLSLGSDVYVITFTDKCPFYKLNDNITHININHNFKNKSGIMRYLEIPKIEILRLKSLITIIKNSNPDYVISFCFTANILNIFQKIIYGKVITVVSERNDPNSYSKLTQLICKFFYKKSDLIVCQSEAVRKYYDYYKSCILPNPLLTENIPGYDNSTEKNKKIVSVGRLVTQKNQKCLINSFFEIHKKYPNHILEIYGDGPLKKELLDHINFLGLNNYVKLMGAKNDVLEYIKDAELFLFSSNYEGFPNALIEAMSIGLPIVTTDFSPGTAEELIENGKNGFIVYQNDYFKMAEKSIQILENIEMRTNMAENNMKIRYIYDINIIGDRWVKILKKIKEKKNGNS